LAQSRAPTQEAVDLVAHDAIAASDQTLPNGKRIGLRLNDYGPGKLDQSILDGRTGQIRIVDHGESFIVDAPSRVDIERIAQHQALNPGRQLAPPPSDPLEGVKKGNAEGIRNMVRDLNTRHGEGTFREPQGVTDILNPKPD